MKRLILTMTLLLSFVFFAACSNDDSTSSNMSSMASKAESIVSEVASNVTSNITSMTSKTSSTVKAEVGVSNDTPIPVDNSNLDIGKLNSFDNKCIGFGQGRRVNELNRPETCDLYQKKYGEHGALFIETPDTPTMYLTFDEGYENGYTPSILDTLKEKDVKATFFVTYDYVKRCPDLIRRMIDEGHTVGNHSMTHPSMPKISTENMIKEIADLHNYMQEKFNYTMTLFRPPMGEWSIKSLEVAKSLGYKTVFWSYAYLDYDPKNQMGVDKAFPLVTKAVHNGAIYLLHAVSKDNTEMLGSLIDNFRQNQFEISLLK